MIKRKIYKVGIHQKGGQQTHFFPTTWCWFWRESEVGENIYGVEKTSLSAGFDCQCKKRESEAVRREKYGGVCEALRREKSEGGFSSHNTEERE